MTPIELTVRLGGQWYGRYGTAPCPVCQPERRADQTALSVAAKNGGGVLVNCKKSACGFVDILRAAGSVATASHPKGNEFTYTRTTNGLDQSGSSSRVVKTIWETAQELRGTIGERYLRQARAISAPLPNSLRFHPQLNLGGSFHPALVARIDGALGFGISRTFLKEDGAGRIERRNLGPLQGGSVRLLSSDADLLVVAEGIETTLALASGMIGEPASYWAALSATNLANIALPEQPGRLTIGADGDDAGRRAAEKLRMRAEALGWKVAVMVAPDGFDWNDVLAGRASSLGAD